MGAVRASYEKSKASVRTGDKLSWVVSKNKRSKARMYNVTMDL